ncbi:hypothetical protein ACKRZS_004014 [Fusarium odoratissimum]
MIATSKPRHATPHKVVSETVRERETFRHWLPFQTPDSLQELRQSTTATNRLSSANVILTALTQLGIYQVGAERAFVSLFDSEYRYYISEATSGTYLRPSAPNHEYNKPFQLCGTAVRRGDDACNYTLLNQLADDPRDGDSSLLPVTVVPNLIQDARFPAHTLPRLLESSQASFYAAVPIRTKQGINIGVYSVINTSHRDWTEANADRLRDISCAISDHLETESLKAVNRRNARMNRGLGSFLEGGSTITGWRLGTNPTDFTDSLWSLEGNLNPRQQSLQQDVDDVADTSRFANVALPTPSGRHAHAPVTDAGRTMGTMSENRSLDNVFSRAANIIRESVEVEGCIFLDATMAGYRANQAMSSDDARSAGHSSATSSDDGTQSQHINDPICDIKGFSTSGTSSIDRIQGPKVSVALSEKFMMKMLKQYPQGKVFIFSDDGELQTSDSSSDDVFTWSTRPEHLDRQAGRESTTALPSPSSMPLGKAQRKPLSRQREGRIISAAFPNARSVAFFPVWDPRQERWRASGLVYTNAPSRTFAVQGELSYLRAFGMLAAAEIVRLEALRDARVKSDALGSLSHELRSPLHGVLLSTELMADTKLDVFQTNIAHTIETCSRTLLDTIDHLLDYSRVNSFADADKKVIRGHLSQHDASTSQSFGKKTLVNDYLVDQLVEDVVETVFAGFNFQHKSISQHVSRERQRSQAGRNSHHADNAANSAADYQEAMDQLTPGISDDTRRIFDFGNITLILSLDAHCDWLYRFHVGAVRRVVMNIVGNALKYTPEGVITISLKQRVASVKSRRPEQVVCFTVKDTGKGISEDFLQRGIFKPFSQENDLSPGTGIGLSLVKQIVSQFRGQILIDSQVGVGTTVTILLPLERPKLPKPEAPPNFSGGFSDQLGDLAGLRVQIISGSLPAPVSIELRYALEYLCNEWLKLELIAQDDNSKRPDLRLWTQDALPPVSEFTDSLALIPNVVICPNALAAYEKTRESYEARWKGVFEFVSQPDTTRSLSKSPSASALQKEGSGSAMMEEFTSPPPIVQSPSTPGSKAPKILLVEDNHINLKILAAYMKKLLLNYDTAVNGKEAVEKYIKAPQDFVCILLDISMPVLNGFETARQIRAFEGHNAIEKGVLIIAISGLASEEAQREAYGSGFNLFLLKPVKLQALGEVLRERGVLDSVVPDKS